MSLGNADKHSLKEKLTQAAKHCFEGIEIFFPDLEALAKEQPGGLTPENQLKAAGIIRQICDENHLEVVSLQPFMFYDGLLSVEQHNNQLDKLRFWFKLVKVLRTDMISIPSNTMQAGIIQDVSKVVQDMTEVAEMGLAEKPMVKFAYENLAWSSVNDTWEGIWEVVQKTNRINFGMILDTFNIAGRLWADPATPSGKPPTADEDLKASLARLVQSVDVNKVFYVQVIDGEKMQQPLVKGHPFHVDGHPSRMDWSRNARLFPLEEDRGAYLPVVPITQAIVRCAPDGLGYKGWVSLELFSRSTQEEDKSVLQQHAQRGSEAWKKLSARLNCE